MYVVNVTKMLTSYAKLEVMLFLITTPGIHSN